MTNDKKKDRNDKLSQMNSMAEIAKHSKKRVLEHGYVPVGHSLIRDFMPEIRNKYDGRTARDGLVLLVYLASFTQGDSNHPFYMWSYPTNEQICEHTGIHKDRLKGLVDLLVHEKLLRTERLPYKGHTKKVYLPILHYDARKQTTHPTGGNHDD